MGKDVSEMNPAHDFYLDPPSATPAGDGLREGWWEAFTEALRQVDAADEPKDWDAAVSYALGVARLGVLDHAKFAASQPRNEDGLREAVRLALDALVPRDGAAPSSMDVAHATSLLVDAEYAAKSGEAAGEGAEK